MYRAKRRVYNVGCLDLVTTMQLLRRCIIVPVFIVFPMLLAQVFDSQQLSESSGVSDSSRKQAGVEMQRNMYLKGRVVLQDGTSPGAVVTISMRCNGKNRPVAYSNLRGYFSFRPAEQSREATGDASVGGVPGVSEGGPSGRLSNDGFDDSLNIVFGGLGGTVYQRTGSIDFGNCEIRAGLTGYYVSKVFLGRRSIGDLNLGDIVLRPSNKSSEKFVSVTSLQLPNKAHKMFEKILQQLAQEDLDVDKITKELDRVVAKFPNFAVAWSTLGDLRMSAHDLNGARNAFEKAITADSHYLKPYIPLIRIELSERKWKRAAQLAQRCRRSNPYLGEFGYYHAIASFNLGDMTAAANALEAFQSSEDAHRFPDGLRMSSFFHVQKGDYPKAAAAMRLFLKASPNSPHAKETQRKLNEWEDMGMVARTSVEK